MAVETLNVHDLEKEDLIKQCQHTIGRGWQKKLAERANLNPSSVTHWVNGRTANSFKADKMAREILKEELKIRALFPQRV